MTIRHATLFVAAVFAASCINYTGLEGDGSEYTKTTAVTSGGGSTSGGSADGGDTCTPSCASTCRTSAVSDGCSGTCDANCATSCSGGVCQAASTPDAGGGTSYTCTAADADDGTSAAASLGAASLDCQFRSSGSNWATAMSYCAGLGSGWRLPSKGEALKIASNPNVCRTPLSGAWYTWTRTCAGVGLAWYVSYDGSRPRSSVDDGGGSYYSALCVR